MPDHLELERELINASERLEVINDTIDKIHANISDDKIGIGSRVLIKWVSGDSNEGRVLRMKAQDSFVVKRDNGAEITVGINHSTITEHTIQHLSVGTYGKLEKEQWLLKERIRQLQNQVNPLRTCITLTNAKAILEYPSFQTWYISNDLESTISLTKLSNSPSVFVCSIAREYLNRKIK